jgi:hypothetical protein
MAEGGLVPSHTKYVTRLPAPIPTDGGVRLRLGRTDQDKPSRPGDATPVSLKLVSVAEGKKILKKGLREEKKKKKKADLLVRAPLD